MQKKNKIYLGIGAGVLLLAFFMRKQIKKPMADFFNELTDFIKRKEGGLSNDKTDTAAKFPSPTPQKYHTNKGITWRTYVDSAKTLNYSPTIENFLKMPDQLWLKIYKGNYLNKTNFTPNKVLNGYMSLWLWGGWNKNFMPISRVTKVLSDTALNDKTKLKLLTNLRIEYFNNIVKANPSQAKFLKGWTSVANKFYEQFSPYL